MTINSISKIVCINHPLAAARLEAMNERFKAQRMKVDLAPGVIPAIGEEPFVGCLRAHKLAIERAKNENHPNLLVFEDDVLFLKPWSWIQAQLTDVPDDFDLVRLGLTTDGLYVREHIKNHIFRCWRAYGTICYLINSKCYDRILKLPETDPLDTQMAQLGLVEYAIHPLPVYHELGTSYLGNVNLPIDDGANFSREEALSFVDGILNTQKFSMLNQVRIVQALATLKEKPITQELRFLRAVLERVEMDRQTATKCIQALFKLSLLEKTHN